MSENKENKKGKRSIERFNHFLCAFCNKWWGIGDPPEEREEWFCPWCGEKQKFEDMAK